MIKVKAATVSVDAITEENKSICFRLRLKGEKNPHLFVRNVSDDTVPNDNKVPKIPKVTI